MTQRIALVTGGSRGLGKNAALKLAAKGTDILLTYHSNRQAAPRRGGGNRAKKGAKRQH